MLERALRQLFFLPVELCTEFVRKHTMLERALRHYSSDDEESDYHLVRKHTMLERALRPSPTWAQRLTACSSQKAYNAREGIETNRVPDIAHALLLRQKAYNAREGIETCSPGCFMAASTVASESIQCSRGH